MRLLVCGSRKYTDKEKIKKELEVIGISNITTLIHGDATGADRLAADCAFELGLPRQAIVPYPAKWFLYGKQAGSIRNQQMLDEGKPDMVLAFPLPGCRGTWNMINLSRRYGINPRIISF